MIAETMNRWTKNRPAVPGNYWMLSNGKARVVEVVDHNGTLCIEHGAFFLPLFHFDRAEWAGPLAMPTHEKREVIVLRDRDGLERMVETSEDMMSFITRQFRVFSYSHQRTEHGVRIFFEDKQ